MKTYQDYIQYYTKELQKQLLGKYRYYTIAVGLIIVLCLGYIGYKYFYLEPKNTRAFEDIGNAQKWFSIDSLDLALNGDISAPGFLKIAKKYKGTKAANFAHFYIGNIYLRQRKYTESIKELENYTPSNDFMASRKHGLLGDAYSENGNVENAVQNYYKAYEYAPMDEYWASENLFKGGSFSLLHNNNELAKKCLIALVENYPKVDKATKAINYLALIGVYNNMGKYE